MKHDGFLILGLALMMVGRGMAAGSSRLHSNVNVITNSSAAQQNSKEQSKAGSGMFDIFRRWVIDWFWGEPSTPSTKNPTESDEPNNRSKSPFYRNALEIEDQPKGEKPEPRKVSHPEILIEAKEDLDEMLDLEANNNGIGITQQLQPEDNLDPYERPAEEQMVEGERRVEDKLLNIEVLQDEALTAAQMTP